MYKPPPRDDEQHEYPQTYYSTQRRRRPAVPRRPQAEYHPDEHPEIPMIRRASLHLDQPTTELPAKSALDEEIEDYKQKSNGRSISTTTSTRNKIIVTQRRHPSVYEPLPPAHHSRHLRPRHPLSARLQQLSHNQTIIIVATLILVALITVPIIVNVIRSQASSTLKGVTTSSGPPSLSSALPPNPHELIITPQDTDYPAPPVLATSAYLLDADTGATLYAYNPFIHLPMLSTTKLMTAVIAAEQGNPDQKITITPAIDHDISKLSADSSLFGIKKGETYTLRDLLYGLLLMSGNDAAIAIADTIGGNVPNFVAKMNQRAHQLGLYDTHYVNPHGLLATGQFSSAHDLAILGRYSMSLPLIHQISGTEQYHMPKAGNHPERFLINGNQFLWWYPGVDGGKPGWDGQSNFVQVISCVRNHHHLIGVVMRTNNWWTDMRDLMNWGFDTFNWISPYDVDIQHPIPFDYLWNYFAKDKKENTIPTADGGRYYIYTGFSISGPIMAYFDQSGGLKKFGYPMSLPKLSNASVISQQFEYSTIQCDLTAKQCTTA